MYRRFQSSMLGWIVLVSVVLFTDTSVLGAETVVPCPATPLEDRLPEVIAPMAGEEPIWLVTSFGKWFGPKVLAKSVWIVSRGAAEDLLVTGHRLDGPGTLLFQLGATPSEKFELSDLEGLWVIPGGATLEIMGEYGFAPMYLIYPSPGCWQITVRLGGETRRIVVEQVEAAPTRER